jgi:hypothetical protein
MGNGKICLLYLLGNLYIGSVQQTLNYRSLGFRVQTLNQTENKLGTSILGVFNILKSFFGVMGQLMRSMTQKKKKRKARLKPLMHQQSMFTNYNT